MKQVMILLAAALAHSSALLAQDDGTNFRAAFASFQESYSKGKTVFWRVRPLVSEAVDGELVPVYRQTKLLQADGLLGQWKADLARAKPSAQPLLLGHNILNLIVENRGRHYLIVILDKPDVIFLSPCVRRGDLFIIGEGGFSSSLPGFIKEVRSVAGEGKGSGKTN